MNSYEKTLLKTYEEKNIILSQKDFLTKSAEHKKQKSIKTNFQLKERTKNHKSKDMKR